MVRLSLAPNALSNKGKALPAAEAAISSPIASERQVNFFIVVRASAIRGGLVHFSPAGTFSKTIGTVTVAPTPPIARASENGGLGLPATMS
jgi:hypothetical protein